MNRLRLTKRLIVSFQALNLRDLERPETLIAHADGIGLAKPTLPNLASHVAEILRSVGRIRCLRDRASTLDPQYRRGRRSGLLRWGTPAPLKTGGAARHEHPQYVLTALARLAEAGGPLLRACEQPRRIRSQAKSGDKEERCGLVRARGELAAILLRRHLDRIEGRARHQIKADPRPTWSTASCRGHRMRSSSQSSRCRLS